MTRRALCASSSDTHVEAKAKACAHIAQSPLLLEAANDGLQDKKRASQNPQSGEFARRSMNSYRENRNTWLL